MQKELLYSLPHT